MGFRWRALAIRAFCGVCLIGPVAAADWRTTLTESPPGSFPLPRSLQANYRFGWSGFTAATAEINFAKLPDRSLRVDGTGRTVGLARALWKMDVNLTASADGRTLRPIESTETETSRSKKTSTHLAFDARGVTRLRSEGDTVPKPIRFDFPNLYDLQSALLYLRSQPLAAKDVERVVVYPTTSPYLATVTVLGREKISVGTGTYDAIKLDLQLSKIDKNGELQPHRKFRRAIGWISDDANRFLLRVSAQIFVGTVFFELQSVQFDGPKQ